MKHKEWLKFNTKNFTGIIEECDGSGYVFLHILYFKNGMRHREDGPAIEYANRKEEWFLDNKSYSKDQWKIEVEKLRKSINIAPK